MGVIVSEIGKALGGAGGKHSITWRGKTLYAHTLELGLIEGFSLWLYKRAKEVLKEDKEDLGEDRYIARLDALRAMYDNNEFDVTGPLGRKAMSTLTGSVKILAMVLELPDADAFTLMQEMPAECQDLLATLDLVSFQRKQKPSGPSPNSPSPNSPSPNSPSPNSPSPNSPSPDPNASAQDKSQPSLAELG